MGKTLELAAQVVHVSSAYVEKAKKIKTRAPEKLQAIRDGTKTIYEVERELKQEALAKTVEPDHGPFLTAKDSDDRVKLCQREASTQPSNTPHDYVQPLPSQAADVIRGWRRHLPLFGSPDFVFPKEKVVVFTDGDFWHGRFPRRPTSNADYWLKKIENNQRRDRKVSRRLRRGGWAVIRMWEDDLKQRPLYCVSRIEQKLAEPLSKRPGKGA